MNVFTKKELECIFDIFNWVEDSPSWRCKEGYDDELKNKIQNMINTYCDHAIQKENNE